MKHISLHRPSGFSMIEVLIAVLILAIGLLGVAALQMASMNSGQESYFRSQATAIAEDYASRIKAGRQAMLKQRDGGGQLIWDTLGPRAAAEAYMANFVANPLLCAAVAPPDGVWCRPDEDAGVDGVACSAAQRVAFERWDICRQAANLMPDGTVHVIQNANSVRVSIAVAWLATAARVDTPEEIVPINPICTAALIAGGFAIPANKDCVVVEAIP